MCLYLWKRNIEIKYLLNYTLYSQNVFRLILNGAKHKSQNYFMNIFFFARAHTFFMLLLPNMFIDIVKEEVIENRFLFHIENMYKCQLLGNLHAYITKFSETVYTNYNGSDPFTFYSPFWKIRAPCFHPSFSLQQNELNFFYGEVKMERNKTCIESTIKIAISKNHI